MASLKFLLVFMFGAVTVVLADNNSTSFPEWFGDQWEALDALRKKYPFAQFELSVEVEHNTVGPPPSEAPALGSESKGSKNLHKLEESVEAAIPEKAPEKVPEKVPEPPKPKPTKPKKKTTTKPKITTKTSKPKIITKKAKI